MLSVSLSSRIEGFQFRNKDGLNRKTKRLVINEHTNKVNIVPQGLWTTRGDTKPINITNAVWCFFCAIESNPPAEIPTSISPQMLSCSWLFLEKKSAVLFSFNVPKSFQLNRLLNPLFSKNYLFLINQSNLPLRRLLRAIIVSQVFSHSHWLMVMPLFIRARDKDTTHRRIILFPLSKITISPSLPNSMLLLNLKFASLSGFHEKCSR